MNDTKYQQCTRCVMDTTDPEITFDENGVCSHCTNFLTRRIEVKAAKKLGIENQDAVVRTIKEKGKGRKYDALLGISGGVDSCYVAWLLKQHGIRTLLVHMDNGWNSDDATVNITNVARKLGFDYESYVLDWEEFKDIQLAFLKASIPEAETPTDIAILGSLHRVAAKKGIKYIVSGGNLATEGILPKAWHYDSKDTVYFNYIQSKFGTRKAKKFPGFGFVQEIYYKLVKDIRMIYFLNYHEFDKDKAKQLLIKELGWKDYGGKHHESRFTKFVQSYLLPEKFDLDYRKATYSTQIVTGELSREKALEMLRLPTYDKLTIEKDKDYIAKKLEISKGELDEILAKKGKWYFEYPNNQKRLEFIYKTYRRYFAK